MSGLCLPENIKKQRSGSADNDWGAFCQYQHFHIIYEFTNYYYQSGDQHA